MSSSAFAGKTLLVLGDSLSAGYRIPIDQAWVSLLQNRLNETAHSYTVINSSISGSTTQNGLERLLPILKIYHPQIVIIELGINDGLRRFPIAVFKHNLLQLIQLAKAEKSQVLLLGTRLPANRDPAYAKAFQQVYTDLATSEKISLVPYFLKNVDDHAELIQSDRLHPTEKAQIIILNNLWPTLENLL